MRRDRGTLVWAGLLAALVVPALLAATSPYLAWRSGIYIAAGFAGIVAMSILLVQPLLAAGLLPGVPVPLGRRWHRWTGALLVLAIVLHVAGLWLTSAPDVIDALTFTSPTPFSDWGVIAMWALFGAAILAALRRRLRLRPLTWRRAHLTLAAIAVIGSIVHAVLIEGTMETVSKILLCALVFLATARVVAASAGWLPRR